MSLILVRKEGVRPRGAQEVVRGCSFPFGQADGPPVGCAFTDSLSLIHDPAGMVMIVKFADGKTLEVVDTLACTLFPPGIHTLTIIRKDDGASFGPFQVFLPAAEDAPDDAKKAAKRAAAIAAAARFKRERKVVDSIPAVVHGEEEHKSEPEPEPELEPELEGDVITSAMIKFDHPSKMDKASDPAEASVSLVKFGEDDFINFCKSTWFAAEGFPEIDGTLKALLGPGRTASFVKGFTMVFRSEKGFVLSDAIAYLKLKTDEYSDEDESNTDAWLVLTHATAPSDDAIEGRVFINQKMEIPILKEVKYECLAAVPKDSTGEFRVTGSSTSAVVIRIAAMTLP